MSNTSTGMGMFNTQLPQFNGKNYDYWAITMRTLFASQDLWELVEDGFEEPIDENEFNRLTPAEKDLLKSNRKKDSKALVFLYQAVDQSVFPRLAAAKTSNEAWQTLKTAYQGMEKVKTAKLQLLRRDFENLNMKESDNIDLFFTHVIGLITQMRTHGETIEERRIVEKILRVLPSKFDTIVTTIEETKDLSNFSVDELPASLITHEQRLSRNENSSLEQAFKTQMSFGRGRGQGRGNKRGRGRSQNRGGRSSPANAEGRGTNPNQNQGQGSSQQREQHHAQGQRQNANVTRENISQNNVLLACNMAETNSEDIWFLDLGCSNHMTGNIALFSTLDKNMKSEVTLGTDRKVSVMAKGEVKIFTKQGERKTIADVYYVPGMRCNLLSIGQLVQKGYNVFFVNDVCTIMDIAPSKRCIAEVKMTRNRLFPLRIRVDLKNKNEIAVVTQEAFQSVPKNENWLWHLRFGHLNFGGLNLLSRKGMVKGLPLIEKPDSLCEGCILGKQHRESFSLGKSTRAKAPLEIIHSDLCGLVQASSLGGNQYFLTFIDDFTRKTWVYFLKNKSEVFEKFRNFKALVENQSRLHIKVLRTDRGGEYISKEFLRFCRENGIHKQFTAGYTPQQNGVAERKNRTIMDMARSMLKAKHLPNDYWAEAVNCEAYILNRCPTKAVMNKVPKEAWSGRKQGVTHMRVFGCVAYAHIPDQLRRKLDSKGEKCIFIGYSEESKAYRLYIPSTKKFFISRDVQFIEEEAWDGSIEKTVNVKNCLSHDEDDEEVAEMHSQTAVPTK
eukprot:PITA_36700